MNEQFNELHLTVMELPIEFTEDVPLYSGYLRELPFITGSGHSKKEMYRQLLENYQEYAEKMTSSLLSIDQLLKYYDGEVFDGFEIDTDK